MSVNKDRKRLVALIIVIIVVFLYIWNTDDLAVDWKTFGEYLAYGLGASFLVYKTIVQTILEPIRKKIAVPKVPK
ncbi:hypothetical protein KAW50_03665 [candidate division WOR-3 bacterium]|nr:hypothetical protein [candidate division WOR-3 bacterium]